MIVLVLGLISLVSENLLYSRTQTFTRRTISSKQTLTFLVSIADCRPFRLLILNLGEHRPAVIKTFVDVLAGRQCVLMP